MNEVVGLIDSEMAQLKSELDVWKKRWQAIDDSLTKLLREIDNGNLPQSISRIQTIHCLLKSLQAFGKSHFNYFYQGFLEDRFELRDIAKNKHPPAVILRSITDQLSFDLQVITQALDQRQLYGNYTEIKNALEKADKLGQMAMRPAIDSEIIDLNTTVLTYFQKTYSVRVVPYANAAIIGIPFSAISYSRDYLAIPHEVAHYIFRHGVLNGRTISSNVREVITKANTDLYMWQWIEEIFADMYGCLVAGPVMAIDFQDLQLDDQWHEFTDATLDEADPVPVLRPDIYTKVLNHSKNIVWHKLVDLLQDRWNDKRNDYLDWKPGDPDIKFKIGNNKEIVLSEIRGDGRAFNDTKKLDKMLSKILARIFDRIMTQVSKGRQGYLEWSGTTEDIMEILQSNNIERLYEKFHKLHDSIHKVDTHEDQKEYIKNNPNEPVVWLPELACKPASLELDNEIKQAGIEVHKIWTAYIKNWASRKGYNEVTDANKVKELLRAKRKSLTNDDDNLGEWGWVHLAYADGWVTRGPEPNPTGDRG